MRGDGPGNNGGFGAGPGPGGGNPHRGGHRPSKAANDGVTHFAALGGNAAQLMVLEREHAQDPALIAGIEGAGVIYFTGGSPDHLLAALADTPLLTAIMAAVDQGTVLAGSSAGAMVMGALMRRPRIGQWVQGLGIAPGIAVLPHHEGRDPEQTSRELQGQIPPETIVLGIDARSGCLGSPGNWKSGGLGKGDRLPGQRMAGLQLRRDAARQRLKNPCRQRRRADRDLPDLAGLDPAGGQQHQGVVEQVGQLAGQLFR